MARLDSLLGQVVTQNADLVSKVSVEGVLHRRWGKLDWAVDNLKRLVGAGRLVGAAGPVWGHNKVGNQALGGG